MKIESKKKFVKRDYTQTEDAKSAKIAFNPNLHLLRKDEIVSGKTFPWEEISIESKKKKKKKKGKKKKKRLREGL